ncbi:MAG TPA: tetratricopeptide repeat protein [Pseudonocardiaceae bacterium]|nr:tetratricopeptide repeat protein [Pseudonocardiaceae bacterium]
MVAGPAESELTIEAILAARTAADLGSLLRRLRRRDARRRGNSQLTYRELAARTGWAHGAIGDYFAGKTVPPTDRLDVLVGLLGASPAETGALATARDRIEEQRRRPERAAGRRVRPMELPRDVTGFVGRCAELAELDRLLDAPLGVAAISGTAGVGKTALAVRWAHRVADRFPDGCLYADLGGYGPGEPVRPDTALAGFLRSMGLPAADLPPAAAELAARFRSVLAGRRMLVVLDNARTADQVRPLLPASPRCFALVTSRDRLAGLVARDGAARVDLHPLTAAEAGELLRELIGQRAEADPRATGELAQRCARLPIALRVAAELAASRPESALAELVAELGELPNRLDLLDAGGDPATAVREIFSWSHRHLPAPAARLFGLLGLHPGLDLDDRAAAALAGLDLGRVRRQLGQLAAAQLFEPSRPGRYRMHDLLRAYAAELAGPAEERRAATERLFDHYLRTSLAAAQVLDPGSSPDGPFQTAAAALEWLDVERPNLVAVAGSAAATGRPAYATGLSRALWRYLDSGGHHGEALRLHDYARRAAAEQADPAGESAALGELGRVYGRLGRFDEAVEHLRAALAAGEGSAGEGSAGEGAVDLDRLASLRNSLAVVYGRLGRFDAAIENFRRALATYRRTGDRASEGKTLGNLGIVHAERGDYLTAADHFTQALELAVAAGDRIGEGDARSNLGHVNHLLGRHLDAIEHHRSALAIARETGDRAGEGRMLASLGLAQARLGRQREALDALDQALRLQRRTGDRSAQAETLSYLADLHNQAGDHHRALDRAEHALAIAADIGERGLHARALNEAGRALLARYRPEQAAARHRAALELTTQLGDRHQHALALEGIGRCLLETGDAREAGEQLREALAILTELGVPDTARVRELLSRLPVQSAGKRYVAVDQER